MIRILHIVSKLSINSGVMNVIMNYYQHIDRTKIQFDFLYFEERTPDFKDEIKTLGGNIFFVNKPSLKSLIKTYKEFYDFFFFNSKQYTAVHLHEIYLVHFIKHFCKKYGIKHLITHAHSTKYSDNPKNALRNKIMCLGLKYSATDLFACSKAAGEFYYGKEAVDRGLVKIIPNAIDLEKYKFNQEIRDKIRKSLNIENKFVIGHIGRMSPPKNQIFLLKVFADLKRLNNNAILLIIGDGPLRKQLEEEIIKLNLTDNVILLGVRNDVPNLLMAMDVFVLPSLYEGLPVVCVEAQATGLRCILSDNITKEVDCGNCEFISLKNKKIWKEKIVEILTKKRKYIKYNEKIKTFNIIDGTEILESFYFSINLESEYESYIL